MNALGTMEKPYIDPEKIISPRQIDKMADKEFEKMTQLKKILETAQKDYGIDIFSIPTEKIPELKAAATRWLEDYPVDGKRTGLIFFAEQVINLPDTETEQEEKAA